MNKTLETTLNLVVAAMIILVGAVYLFTTFAPAGLGNSVPGQSNDSHIITGSVARLNALPSEYVEAAATTTNTLTSVDGGLINQEVFTENVSRARFLITARGLTATSTLYIKQQVSFDDTTYFDVLQSTSTSATSTFYIAKVFAYDPGVATTSRSFDVDIVAAPHSRFLLLQDDASTDPTDGVKAAVTVVLVKNTF